MEPWSRTGAALALGAAALSLGCSSSSHSSGPAALEYTPIKAPECIADTAGAFVTQNTPPVVPHFPSMPNTGYYLVVRYLGEDSIAGSPGYDWSSVTGLPVPEPRSRWQRARTDDATPGTSSAFQLHCTDAGSFLDTATFPWRDIVGGGPHTVYGFAFNTPAPQPLFDASPGTQFVIQANAEVPWLRTTVPGATLATPGPLGQVNLFAYFRDRRSAKVFGLILGIFDSRYGATGLPESRIDHDTYTPYLSQPLGSPSAWVARPAESQAFSGLPWTGLRLFRGMVTQERFARAIADVNAWCRAHRSLRYCDAASTDADAYSADPLDYEVTDFGVLHEVLRGSAGGDIAMGLHVSDVGLWNAR